MSSYAVVVIRIEFENFVHEVIDAFAANRADEAFDISVVLSESICGLRRPPMIGVEETPPTPFDGAEEGSALLQR
jgi:hypothetical protein